MIFNVSNRLRLIIQADTGGHERPLQVEGHLAGRVHLFEGVFFSPLLVAWIKIK